MTLGPLTSQPREFTIVGWDTEFCPAHTGPEAFLCGAVAYPDGSRVLHVDGESYVDELIRHENRNRRLFAHNVGVDVANGLEPFLPREYELRVMSVGYKILSARVRDPHDNTWSFRDSSQISYYTPLEQIGDMMGYEKGDPGVDWNQGCLCDLPAESIKQIAGYCARDAEIVRRWIAEYIQPILVDEFESQLERTAAGTSMNVWRRNYLEAEYPILPKWHREFIRESYRGGRTEMFHRGGVQECYGYDINSLYPHVYTSYEFPLPRGMDGRLSPDRDTLHDHLDETEGFADVTIRAPDSRIPYLRWWDHTRDKLVFPTGTMRDVYTYLEIREALKRGYELQEVHKTLTFHHTGNPFEDFGKDLYALRQTYKEDGDEIRDLVLKLLLNSFYGRFGVDTSSDDAGFYVFPPEDVDLESEIWEMSVNWTNDMMNAWDDGELRYYFEPFQGGPPVYTQPQWASYITAASRHELYTWFEEVGLENVLYCDTDSVYSREPLPESMLGSGLGDMDHEFTGPARFFREKGYVLFHRDGEIEKVKASGFNQAYVDSKYEALQALRGEREVRVGQWGGITGPRDWGSVSEVVKTLGDSWKPKRVYQEDGTSSPLHIKEREKIQA